MHEFELGVWKAVLLHLIRMLHTRGQEAVDQFNERSVVLAAAILCTIDDQH